MYNGLDLAKGYALMTVTEKRKRVIDSLQYESQTAFLEAYERYGTVGKACEASGSSRSRVYIWRKEDIQGFAGRWELSRHRWRGREPGDADPGSVAQWMLLCVTHVGTPGPLRHHRRHQAHHRLREVALGLPAGPLVPFP